jgi:hypothetical protein
MSDPILPLLQWPSGIQQASVPANDNALRLEALSRPALGVANDESGPADGDVWIVGDTPVGEFLNFDPDDIALYHVDEVTAIGGWHAWAPVDGVRIVLADVRMVYAGSSGWVNDPAGGGGGMTNPMTTAGDIIYGGSSGTPTRLGAGTNGHVLTLASGVPTWAASGGGGGSDVVDVITPSNSSGTVTLDFDSMSKYAGSITLSANVTTLAFSNLPGAGKYAEYELHITQDGTGSRTFAIPASHKALGGSDTAIASAANAVTVLTASTVDNGTTWRYAMQESA